MSAAIRCDTCGKFAEQPGRAEKLPDFVRPSTLLPAGWLRVYVFGGGKGARDEPDEVGEVCSRVCGSRWLSGGHS